MPKDHIERKTYRKSPGRQYEYDPLRSRSDKSQSGRGEITEQSERWATRRTTGTTGTKNTTAPLAQRPDPRRTRQLLRQNIIASKTRQGEDEEYVESQEEERYISSPLEERASRSGQLPQPRMPSTRELIDTEEFGRGEARWRKMEVGPEIDPDFDEDVPPRLKGGERLGVDYEEEPYEDEYPAYPEGVPVRSGALLPPQAASSSPPPQHDIPVRASRRLPPVRPHPADEPYEDEYDDYEEYYEDDYEEEEEEERPRRKRRKGGLTRRGLLLGVGAAAVIGTGAAVYEYGPKLPQVAGATGAAVEKQIQDAFNKGMAQGAEAARKELITALDNLEGFSLDGAITAARLTRVAYDVFVSPVIQFGATVATDFLSAMLKAFKTARMLLAGVYQDNTTLQAIQKVLESWVSQVTTMPKQLNAITEADLDGAQAYLRALQRKIEQEKQQIQNNGTPVAGTPTTQPTTKPTPKPKS
jgi:hypothetical protein